ncbi:MAG: hypothetical protein CM1200mP2_02160 [Planctomycetaceae bacterium]|nr:MAG: hypothetical protein CM1200mP2_02160 [Planctomycetaceae bacterium]
MMPRAHLLAKLPERLTQVAARKGMSMLPLPLRRGCWRCWSVFPSRLCSRASRWPGGRTARGQFRFGRDDGKWDAEDLKTGWRHSLAKPGTIILDLGSEKPSRRTCLELQRWWTAGSWLEGSRSLCFQFRRPDPRGQRNFPRAPGANGTPDFSIQLPGDQVRGRYVILKAKSLWAPSNFAGLSEVQVIGY